MDWNGTYFFQTPIINFLDWTMCFPHDYIHIKAGEAIGNTAPLIPSTFTLYKITSIYFAPTYCWPKDTLRFPGNQQHNVIRTINKIERWIFSFKDHKLTGKNNKSFN